MAEVTPKILEDGIEVRRVKHRIVHRPATIIIDGSERILHYPTFSFWQKLAQRCMRKEKKKLHLSDVLEVREGYKTDGLHKASKKFKFQCEAPEQHCFSIIYKHPKFVVKSIDFVASSATKRAEWIEALRSVVTQRSGIGFDEKIWLMKHFKKADLNKNGEISFDELWKLLTKLNLQMSELYVQVLYKEVLQRRHKSALDEDGFFELFHILTDLPEYRSALRLVGGNDEEQMDAKALVKFLQEEQKFADVDEKKAEAIIDLYEIAAKSKESETNGETKKSALTINGFRRLLQSRWGFIMKPGHEEIFQDMDQPLCSYFINSSHNTYLTGLQLRGNATVEGYISALRKGARLLELDVFDGENGEPVITHKRTIISPITLRDALKCIAQYAFQTSPYPLILTLENHVGRVQQYVMADIFTEILGEMLYIPKEEATTKPLPSPTALKNKILLRGKVAPVETVSSEEDPESPDEKKSIRPPTQPEFGRLIALPSVKLSPNLYADTADHPPNGSASLAEGDVQKYLKAGAPMAAYTSKHLIKSFPSGIRQDSSNMNPIPSWISGIQCVAMNMQTADEAMDLVNGLFSINGGCGYVLKPKILLDGIDPIGLDRKPQTLQIAIICGQYLPKSEPGSDVVDPYVSVEILGVPMDEAKSRTRAIRNNGFNPVWNEQFSFRLFCPELAILRLVVKDFDSTSSNDFIGEFSIPVTSIRSGYSHIPLKTGFAHILDNAASIFARIEYEG